MLTVERDSQDAKHLAPLVWQGPVSKNETNNNPPPPATTSGQCRRVLWGCALKDCSQLASALFVIPTPAFPGLLFVSSRVHSLLPGSSFSFLGLMKTHEAFEA